jgi:hypothetical protein
MTKTQRELLMLVGILIVIGVILILRLGGNGDIPDLPPADTVPSTTRTATSGSAGDPGSLLITQAPMEMLNPALSDSAVTARITTGRIRDPFATNRRTNTRVPTTTTTTQQTTQQTTTREPEMRENIHTEWPEGVRYDLLISRTGRPGEYSVLFNDQPVLVGEVIPGTRWNNIPETEWKLLEATPLRIVIQREVHTTEIWEVSTYRYVIRPSMESFR